MARSRQATDARRTHAAGRADSADGPRRLLRDANRAIKRATDIVLGTVGLLVSLPLIAVAALAIMARDPGPWWHVQVREGRGGRSFRMWKLRTMYRDADERLAVHLARDERARHEWQNGFKLSHDPRVLPGIGTFLRRSSLDECPQFWNVIRGDMSIVGPRPLPSYHLAACGPEFLERRRTVRPGMTGLWQVRSRGRGDVRTLELVDTHYIERWSVGLEVSILAKTVAAVLKGRGAR
ncbi:MAG TPA: sugar transferase [Gemmatimonadales bacterium]|nr:sugar transferase [Gemmatimonadales bacterium]